MSKHVFMEPAPRVLLHNCEYIRMIQMYIIRGLGCGEKISASLYVRVFLVSLYFHNSMNMFNVMLRTGNPLTIWKRRQCKGGAEKYQQGREHVSFSDVCGGSDLVNNVQAKHVCVCSAREHRTRVVGRADRQACKHIYSRYIFIAQAQFFRLT